MADDKDDEHRWIDDYTFVIDKSDRDLEDTNPDIKVDGAFCDRCKDFFFYARRIKGKFKCYLCTTYPYR